MMGGFYSLDENKTRMMKNAHVYHLVTWKIAKLTFIWDTDPTVPNNLTISGMCVLTELRLVIQT